MYDGANVGATLGERWVFVQGDGVDDPLMGLYRSSSQPGVATEYYWITDGAGRHLAAGSANGTLGAGSQAGMQYLNLGGKFVGTTQAATSYHAERQSTASAPTLSMFRHRVYDQRTGRWAQEDPLGIAGGLNLYQFNGSNPSSYSDPFGLAPCPPDNDCGWLTAALTITGALAGGGLGGGLGLSCGPGAPVCIAAGAATFSAKGAAAGAALGTALGVFFSKSHTVATTTVAGHGTVRVDWEEPAGNRPGNVHVQGKGKGAIGKFILNTVDDLKNLPTAVRNNPTVQQGVKKAFEMLERISQ